MKKETKSTKLEIRVTEEEKQRYKAFAADHGATISDLVRQALESLINGGKEE